MFLRMSSTALISSGLAFSVSYPINDESSELSCCFFSSAPLLPQIGTSCPIRSAAEAAGHATEGYFNLSNSNRS